MEGALQRLLSDADRSLGRLDGITTILPNPELFVAMYVRREAVLSSQIEGTQASLTDVLVFEADEEHDGDLADVACRSGCLALWTTLSRSRARRALGFTPAGPFRSVGQGAWHFGRLDAAVRSDPSPPGHPHRRPPLRCGRNSHPFEDTGHRDCRPRFALALSIPERTSAP
jgi:hypothetical protein